LIAGLTGCVGLSGNPVAFADYLDAKYKGSVKCIIPKIMEEIIV
jgi:hypothetical protein